MVGKDDVLFYVYCCSNGILLNLFSKHRCKFCGAASSVAWQQPLISPNEIMDITP